MQYVLLIYDHETRRANATEAEQRALSAEYRTFTESIAKSGHYKGGEALQLTSTATTVRVRDGKTLMSDGPFAETKEQLAGFYLVEAANLDEAAALAARIPGARLGAIEVRPILPTR